MNFQENLPSVYLTFITVFLSVCLRKVPRNRKFIMSFFVHIQTHNAHDCGHSPAELFLRKQLRSRFDLLHPDVSGRVQESQARQQRVHDMELPQRIPYVSFVSEDLFRYIPGIVNHSHATKEFSRGRCARSNKQKTSPKMFVCGVTHTKGMQLR